MTRFDPSSEPERIIRDLEQQIRNYPLRTVRLTGAGNKLVGLFLLSRNVPLSEAALQRTLADLSTRLEDPLRSETPAHAPPAGNSCLATPPRTSCLEEILTAEFARIQHTSLPCALILLQLDSTPELQPPGDQQQLLTEITTLVRAAVRCSDIILPCDSARFAVILPGISLREASGCAERISRELGRKITSGAAAGPTLTASIGIGFCQSPTLVSATTFTARVVRELERAREQGGNRICQAVLPADFSCQVSVEERAELFGIFAGKRHP